MQPDLFYEIAKYLPNEERRRLVKRLFEFNDYSITKTAKQAGINRAQLYRYLGLSKRQNFPSDSITARVLKALHSEQPTEVIYLLQEVADRFLRLIDILKRDQAKPPNIPY